MLAHAKTNERPLLLISNDTKEDWVNQQGGMIIGPRPELVGEMKRTAGVDYHQMTLPSFLERASSALQVAVSQNTIDQARQGATQNFPEVIQTLIRERDALVESRRELTRELRSETARYSSMGAKFDAIRERSSALESRTQALETEVALARDAESTDRLRLLEEDLARSRGELYTIIEERDSLISALSESRERIAYLRHGIKKEEHDVGRIDLVLKYQGVQTKNLIPRPHSSIRAAQERSSGAELE